ncbi:copper resistance protein B [Sphingobium sp. AEW010]|nr:MULTISPECIES: copper resistance protein B [unclassified Sphingobium]MBG6120318.1 copper resistance protein B [Sphingobium sp. JAI105]PSO11053.1 copper resistance protein CopB [Sphingobium sp. AEW4]TWD05554.1 copper resistance protein B [Sphingobium sp. AEW010]TWD22439.1 copper resistance protein B [Sphingobium sp. AEW013]TWD25018.1 copper resistance protein B [Sphingobium sp. AEW001]
MKQLIAAATLLLAAPAVGQEIHVHQIIDNKEQNEKPMPSVGEVPADPHAGHIIPTTDDSVPQGVAPPIPTDYAAEAFYPAATMARARAAMIRESGGMTFSQLMLDRLEYRAHKGANGYAWEGEGWIGGDINRFAFKTEGEGEVGGPLESAEVQGLYSRALNPWFNVEAGVRQDFRPQPQRTYAVVGIEGLAPYWFEVGAQAFLSNKGDAHLRLEGSYDQRITQRLILQPAAEMNVAAQDVPELGIGSGISDIELGLRLRYEFAREFAPYVGVHWERKLGDTARYARAAGEGASVTSLVLGARFWF